VYALLEGVSIVALFVEERRRYILEQLNRHGRVSVKELSDEMQVSAVTIRQDLRILEDDGLLERTYGGAVRRSVGLVPPELSFHVRMSRRWSEKDSIAAYAASFVQEGYSVALDASTSAYAVAQRLKAMRRLTVVTNSLMIAQLFLDTPSIQVMMPGGRLRRDSISLVGRPDLLPDLNLNVGFHGARGVSPLNGITDVDADEVSLKQAMIARTLHTYILVDASKWGQVAPYTFIRPAQVHSIITSADAPPGLIGEIRAQGTDVHTVLNHRGS
jgi:DeoR family fructose operon transcriptional repressor